MSLLKIISDSRVKSCGPVSLNVSDARETLAPDSFKGRAAVVTLGCAKNQVDSEVMLGVLRSSGFEIVNDIGRADVAIVNTCGFLESAVKESIDSILDVAEYKEKGSLRRLIVAGCMVERYKDDLKKSMPEVDGFVSVDEVLRVGEVALGDAKRLLEDGARPYFLYDDTMPRHLASRPHTAYVKIGEGCNRPCTFCIIPKIRGRMRSRTVDSVVQEAVMLGERGVRELNLVAQDSTSYGSDLERGDLATLLGELDRSRAVDWVRLLYAYPIGIDEKLIDAIMGLPRVCEYLDLPLQHSSESVLKDMKRPLGRYSPRRIVELIKTRAPSLHLRTTFIVGFPGETEEDVADLESFIREGHFGSVGIFTYSREAGTPAYDLPGQVDEREKARRRERLMQAQQEVVGAQLESMIGREIDVLVEGAHEETDMLLVGRARFQAPDVDGTVIVNELPEGVDGVEPGSIVKVRISEAAGYDLIGAVVEPQ